MVLAFSAFLIRHGTAEKRAEEAEQRPLEGVEEEEAMTRYQKMLFWLNGPCIFCIFEDAVTCSGASVPENVQKPPRLRTKVGFQKGRDHHRLDDEGGMIGGRRPPAEGRGG